MIVASQIEFFFIHIKAYVSLYDLKYKSLMLAFWGFSAAY